MGKKILHTDELVLKLAATFMAVIMFAMLFWWTLRLTPPHPALPKAPGGSAYEGARRVKQPGAGDFDLPLPYNSQVIHGEESEYGEILLVSSKIDPHGIKEFYLTEMALLGWRASGPFQIMEPPGDFREPATALYFTDGSRHCIINIMDGNGPGTSYITMIKSHRLNDSYERELESPGFSPD